MKERPILFNSEMVLPVLENLKTMTRRVMKVSPKDDQFYHAPFSCPYGKAGDRLWVKETWSGANSDQGACICYKADLSRAYIDENDFPDVSFDNLASNLEQNIEGWWKVPQYMPRLASRILLEIKDVGFEQLNSISNEDAIKEGFSNREEFINWWDSNYQDKPERQSINNPYVWVIEFRRIELLVS